MPYEFDLYTHCGVGNTAVDFDGSMWVLPTPPPHLWVLNTLNDPYDHGSMQLLGRDEAKFISQGGTALRFYRHDGPRVVPRCE